MIWLVDKTHSLSALGNSSNDDALIIDVTDMDRVIGNVLAVPVARFVASPNSKVIAGLVLFVLGNTCGNGLPIVTNRHVSRGKKRIVDCRGWQ